MGDQTYDVVIVGASLGGVAAALRAADMGVSVCLLEAGTWVGGQYTAQGVSKPDENRYIETVGSTSLYRAFRHNVRAYYRNNYHLSAIGASQPTFNPGGSYPGFATEPSAGHHVLFTELSDAPSVHVRLSTRVTAVDVNGDTIGSVTAVGSDGTSTRYIARYFLDATDLGELLPMAGAEHHLGAEARSETGEADAPQNAQPRWIQPITLPFALERRPQGEDHTIARPAEYDRLKAEQKYTIVDGYIDSMFVPGRDMWSYRRFIDAANFDDPAFPHDITMINTGSNDYQAATIPSGNAATDAAIVARARQASLGYCYWLQTECRRDDDPSRRGYPELRLRTDVFKTSDGTAAQPYIRESRRIKALTTIVQGDLDAQNNPGPRGKRYRDGCGIGFYGGLDIHGLASVGMPQSFISIKPFHLPLGALIPIRMTNLLAACKNLGVTHITNGAYRLHPVEWNIGESAGALAAFCVRRNVAPKSVPSTPSLLRDYQHAIVTAGIPLFWWSDVTFEQPIFAAVHLLGVAGIMGGFDDMSFRPDLGLDSGAKTSIESRVGRALPWPSGEMSRGQAALWLVAQLGL